MYPDSIGNKITVGTMTFRELLIVAIATGAASRDERINAVAVVNNADAIISVLDAEREATENALRQSKRERNN